jgi:hypothetical protein
LLLPLCLIFASAQPFHQGSRRPAGSACLSVLITGKPRVYSRRLRDKSLVVCKLSANCLQEVKAAGTLNEGTYFANHKTSTSQKGVTASSPFRIPRINALTSEYTISRSRSPQARLCAKNPNSSTSPIHAGDSRDVLCTFTFTNNSSLFSGLSDALFLYVFRVGSRLSTSTREINTAQKPAQVSRQGDETDGQEFDRIAVPWQVH